VDCGMIDAHAAPGHDLFQVMQAEIEGRIHSRVTDRSK
jgi:hypothetical protein